MPVGTVSLTIRDGGLGITPATNSNLVVHLGTCSLGTPNTLYSLSSTDDVVANLGAGPLVESGAYQLGASGGSTYLIPVTASVAGVAGAVTPTRVATSTSVMTTTGAPNDAYGLFVKVVTPGTGQLITSGAVGIQVSLDGGQTFAPQALIPAAGTVVLAGTGLSIVFTAGAANLDAGDVFTATCQAPFYGASDLQAAFTALGGLTQTWGLVHPVGYPTAGNSTANSTAAAALAATVSANMTTFANNYRYARAILDCPPSADADLMTAFAAFADGRVVVPGTTCPLNSTISGRKLTRPWAWTVVARLAASRVSVSPGRISDGPMVGVISLTRDERKTPGLFDARFSVAQSILGLNGFYADTGKTMAPAGSDYSLIMNGRVMDVACTTTRTALLQFLNTGVRVNSTTGTILEADARGIESVVNAKLRAAVVQTGDASDCTVQINRTDNILSTGLLRVKTRLVPLAYATAISEDIGFSNPALVLS